MAEIDTSDHERVLVVCAGNHVCAIPCAIVEEIMRPLPTESLPGVAPYVRGLAVVRGKPIPVLDLGLLLGAADATDFTRFAVLRLHDRRVVIAVQGVPGLRLLGRSLLSLSRILDEANPALARVGVRDQNLLLVLEVARIVPDDLWEEIESKAVAS